MDPRRPPQGPGHGLPNSAPVPQFTHNLSLRPAPKRKANDSSGDEAATAKKQKENPTGPGIFSNSAASTLSVTQMRAQRVADV